jgi:arsenical pump membrane protein
LEAPPAAAVEALDEGKERALRLGGLVVALVLVGFVAGRDVGIQPWMVALGADAVLIVLVGHLPWRQVPVGTALVAASLGVLASAAAGHLPIHRLIDGTSTAASARTIGVTAVAANVANNLPALLVTLPQLHHGDGPALWAVLLGVNMGPVVLVTGSLASLLWMGTLGRLGVAVRAWDFTRVGLRVGVPGAAAGVGVYLALHAAGV